MEPGGNGEDGDALVDALRSYGVRYLSGGTDLPQGTSTLPPDTLLEALAQSRDARLRNAIAPLLLVRPDLVSHVQVVVERLAPPAKDVLIEEYVAAVYLQRAWRTRLRRYLGEQPVLPSLWIDERGLPDPNERAGHRGLDALRSLHRRGATARRSIHEQVAFNLFGQLVADRGPRALRNAA